MSAKTALYGTTLDSQLVGAALIPMFGLYLTIVINTSSDEEDK